MADTGPPGPRPGPPRPGRAPAGRGHGPGPHVASVCRCKSAPLSQDGTAGVRSAGRGPGASGACRSRWAVTRSPGRRRHWLSKTNDGRRGRSKQTGCFAKQSGLFPRLGEYSNVGSESGKRKSTEGPGLPRVGICDIRSTWLQAPSFPRARPRMCRREVLVAALGLIEAHSHTLSSFRRIRL